METKVSYSTQNGRIFILGKYYRIAKPYRDRVRPACLGPVDFRVICWGCRGRVPLKDKICVCGVAVHDG